MIFNLIYLFFCFLFNFILFYLYFSLNILYLLFYFLFFKILIFLFLRFEQRLGFADSKRRKTPTLLLKDESIKQISTAYNHTLILKENGDVLGFGSNGNQKLVQSKEITLTPQTVLNESNLKQVFSTYHASFFLNNDGSISMRGKFSEIDNKNHLLIQNSSIKYFNETQINEWSPENHHLFSRSFKQSTLCFVCCLKRINQKYNLKLPKYLLFMIVKFSV